MHLPPVRDTAAPRPIKTARVSADGELGSERFASIDNMKLVRFEGRTYDAVAIRELMKRNGLGQNNRLCWQWILSNPELSSSVRDAKHGNIRGSRIEPCSGWFAGKLREQYFR